MRRAMLPREAHDCVPAATPCFYFPPSSQLLEASDDTCRAALDAGAVFVVVDALTAVDAVVADDQPAASPAASPPHAGPYLVAPAAAADATSPPRMPLPLFALPTPLATAPSPPPPPPPPGTKSPPGPVPAQAPPTASTAPPTPPPPPPPSQAPGPSTTLSPSPAADALASLLLAIARLVRCSPVHALPALAAPSGGPAATLLRVVRGGAATAHLHRPASWLLCRLALDPGAGVVLGRVPGAASALVSGVGSRDPVVGEAAARALLCVLTSHPGAANGLHPGAAAGGVMAALRRAAGLGNAGDGLLERGGGGGRGVGGGSASGGGGGGGGDVHPALRRLGLGLVAALAEQALALRQALRAEGALTLMAAFLTLPRTWMSGYT
jgi:hypothetical protein